MPRSQTTKAFLTFDRCLLVCELFNEGKHIDKLNTQLLLFAFEEVP